LGAILIKKCFDSGLLNADPLSLLACFLIFAERIFEKFEYGFIAFTLKFDLKFIEAVLVSFLLLLAQEIKYFIFSHFKSAV